jgi:hypothetical protein
LKKTERDAARSGADLSAWEGEFLSDVAQRLKTYGRAFADPDKGAPGAALSALQGFKLRQISAKARGEDRKRGRIHNKADDETED